MFTHCSCLCCCLAVCAVSRHAHPTTTCGHSLTHVLLCFATSPPCPPAASVLGDRRSNQNPAILSFGILMFRWHNVLAARFQREYPDWSDEEVFQKARRMVIASLQNIIMYEYLPTLLGDDDPVAPYSGYKPDIHPGISHVFQSAAFRFGHTMIPPGLYRRSVLMPASVCFPFCLTLSSLLFTPFGCQGCGMQLQANKLRLSRSPIVQHVVEC